MPTLQERLKEFDAMVQAVRLDRENAIATEPRTFSQLAATALECRAVRGRYVVVYADGTRASYIGYTQRPGALKLAERQSHDGTKVHRAGYFTYDLRTGEVLNAAGEVVHQGPSLDDVRAQRAM